MTTFNFHCVCVHLRACVLVRARVHACMCAHACVRVTYFVFVEAVPVDIKGKELICVGRDLIYDALRRLRRSLVVVTQSS